MWPCQAPSDFPVFRPCVMESRGFLHVSDLQRKPRSFIFIMAHTLPKLHNAMWPGLVGKGGEGGDPPISLDRMLELTANAEVGGQKFEGVDLFLFHPHTDPDAADDAIKEMADKIAGKGLAIGSLVAPVWPGTVGSTAMGTQEDRDKFVLAVKKACRIAQLLNKHGVRK